MQTKPPHFAGSKSWQGKRNRSSLISESQNKDAHRTVVVQSLKAVYPASTAQVNELRPALSTSATGKTWLRSAKTWSTCWTCQKVSFNAQIRVLWKQSKNKCFNWEASKPCHFLIPIRMKDPCLNKKSSHWPNRQLSQIQDSLETTRRI